jgi:hypothetical protein
MRRAADQNDGAGRHNWGQGLRLRDQWGPASGLATRHSTQTTFLPVLGVLNDRVLPPLLDLT